MLIVKDIIVIPIILIPVLIYSLIFSRDEKELILSLFLVITGVVLYRYFNFKVMGAILMISGTLFINLSDRNYKNGRFSFISSYTNPIFLRYYDRFILSLKNVFNPLFEFRYFNILSKVFYWTSAGVWMIILIVLMIMLNKNFASFLFTLIIPIGAFVYCYYVD